MDDGEQCRCLKLRRTDTAGDVIKKMQAVEADWRTLEGPKHTSVKQTDVRKQNYRLVAFTAKNDNDGGQFTSTSVREEVLGNEILVGSDRFREIRETWSRLFVRHLLASFAHKRSNADASKTAQVVKTNSGMQGGLRFSLRVCANGRKSSLLFAFNIWVMALPLVYTGDRYIAFCTYIVSKLFWEIFYAYPYSCLT